MNLPEFTSQICCLEKKKIIQCSSAGVSFFCFSVWQQSLSITVELCCVTAAQSWSAIAGVFISENVLLSGMLYADAHKTNLCSGAMTSQILYLGGEKVI